MPETSAEHRNAPLTKTKADSFDLVGLVYTIQQHTQAGDSCKCPAGRVPSDNYTILFMKCFTWRE